MRNLLLLAAGGAFCALQEGAERSVAYQDTSSLTDVPYGGRPVGYESRLKSGVTARPHQNRMKGRLRTALAAVLVVALSAAFLILQCFMLIKSKGLVASVRRLAEGGHPTCSGDGQQGQQGQQEGQQDEQQGQQEQQGQEQQGDEQQGKTEEAFAEKAAKFEQRVKEFGEKEKVAKAKEEAEAQAEAKKEDQAEAKGAAGEDFPGLQDLLDEIHQYMPPDEVDERFPSFANGNFETFEEALKAFHKYVTEGGQQEGAGQQETGAGDEGAGDETGTGEAQQEGQATGGEAALEELVQELQRNYIPPEEIIERFTNFANGNFETFEQALKAFYEHVTQEGQQETGAQEGQQETGAQETGAGQDDTSDQTEDE